MDKLKAKFKRILNKFSKNIEEISIKIFVSSQKMLEKLLGIRKIWKNFEQILKKLFLETFEELLGKLD